MKREEIKLALTCTLDISQLADELKEHGKAKTADVLDAIFGVYTSREISDILNLMNEEILSKIKQ